MSLSKKGNVLIYGAYGYTGRYISELAAKKGIKITLAGRNRKKLELLGSKLNVPTILLDLNNPLEWDSTLSEFEILLNCAGPFILTIEHIVPACLRNGVHYLDITGEIDVFQWVSSLDKEAKEANISLIPGVGFDVVPTDCLAANLKEKLPNATHLELAFQSNSGLSRGTALSMARRFHEGGTIRKDGKLVQVPAVNETRTINYGEKDRLNVSIAWGDVFTAFKTTGIPNIKVYSGINEKMLSGLLKAKKYNWLLKTSLIQWVLRKVIRTKIDGPSVHKRDTYQTYIWGKVYNSDTSYEAELITPESYYLTALTSVKAISRVLEGDIPTGYQTPALAFGKDFIFKFEKVIRKGI